MQVLGGHGVGYGRSIGIWGYKKGYLLRIRNIIRLIIHLSTIVLDIRHFDLLSCSVFHGLDLGKLTIMTVEALLIDHST